MITAWGVRVPKYQVMRPPSPPGSGRLIRHMNLGADMRTKRLLSLVLILSLSPFLPATVGYGQTPRTRILEGLEIDRDGDVYEMRIRFNAPFQYLRHSPLREGDLLHVQLSLLEVPGDAPNDAVHRESLRIPRGTPGFLRMVSYEDGIVDEPLLEVRFARPVRFQVSRGSDMRSLVVRVEGPPRAPANPAGTAPRQPSAAVTGRTPGVARGAALSQERLDEMMAEGRRAMTAGEFERAALIFGQVASLPENPESPQALELLAMARERMGQLAHAKAEYEEYLRRYPDGEGAARVRQRLQTLVTARIASTAPPENRKRRVESRPLDFRGFGSIYVGYRRASSLTEAEGEDLFDSSLYTDMHLDTRIRREDLTLRGQMTSGFRHDFLDEGSGNQSRISTLFFAAEHRSQGLSGSIGRRSRSSGGVLGRYDGVEVAYRFGELWKAGVLAGIPVDSPVWSGFEAKRFVGGVNLEFGTFAEAFDAEVFAVAQLGGGMMDRAAVGGELRYFRDGLMLAGFIDYDFYFTSLNIAQLVGNWQVTPATNLHTLLDYRNIPTLTSRNALQGQPVGDVDDLLPLLGEDEVKQLAQDRTARATTLSGGVSHRLSERYQVAFDFSASDISGTAASAGVPATTGTGFEFSYFGQLISNGLLRPGDIGVVGLRYFDGKNSDVAMLTLDGRYPATVDLRVNPRLRAFYRTNRRAADSATLIPSLRFDYRFWRLSFDAEFGLDWRIPVGGGVGVSREFGYFLSSGVRYDF
jgi:hypothetical protein